MASKTVRKKTTTVKKVKTSSSSSSSDVDIENCRLSPNEIVEVRQKLLSWYDANRRKLPWRGDAPPYNSSLLDDGNDAAPQADQSTKMEVSAYGTWVSEVMLQQTRVDTVIKYYLKWMEKFPTLQALASATKEEVVISRYING
jgi:A/G-specific adenine glycosylase